MNVKEKFALGREGLEKYGPVTIAAFGDSVTHGFFALGQMDYDAVYHNRLKKMIDAEKNFVPVSIINAGYGGASATSSVKRIESSVLAHAPDLVIICFGLNDVTGELEDYLSSLKTMFTRCRGAGADVLFMTPNMLNTYVDDALTGDIRDYAVLTASLQNGGKMDLFMDSAKKLAEKEGVPVCDCYAKWKELSRTKDTTALLVNHVNHPEKQMHELFAQELYKCIFA